MKLITTYNSIKSVSLVLALSAIMGCQFKSTPKNDHEAAKDTSVKTSDDMMAKPVGPMNLKQNYELAKSLQADNKTADKTQNALKIYNDLQSHILNTKVLDEPKNQNSQEMSAALSYFNLAFLTLAERKALPTDALENYIKIITRGCDAQLKHCLYLGFFNKDHNTSRILILKTEQIDEAIEKSSSPAISDVRAYYRYLLIAYDLRNRVKSFELDFMFAKRAQLYANLLAALPKDQILPGEKEQIEKIGRSFEIVINELQNHKANPKVQDFINKFNPWTYSRLNADVFNYGTSKIFSLAAQTQLYTEKGEVNPALLEAIKKSQTGADKFGPSFTELVAELKAERNPLTSTFISKDINTQSEIFFMVDRLYRGHLSPEDVNELWQGAARKKGTTASLELLNTIDNYTKVQILKMLKETNNYVKSIYTKGDYGPRTMIEKVLENSRDLYSQWSDVLARIDKLKVFAERSVQTNTQTKAKLEETKNLIESLPRNIKYLAVYPQMMIMSYFLKKLDAVLKIFSWFGVVEIPAGTVVQAFLEGFLQPWFHFGNDEIPLNQVELLFAFSYALEGGVFETFQGEQNKEKVTYENFFKSVVREYLASDKEVLTNARQRMNDFTRKTNYLKFMGICNGTEKSHEIPYSEVGSSIFTGNLHTDSNALLQTMHEFYKFQDNSPAYVLAYSSALFPRKKMFVQAMGQILSEFLAKTNYSAADRKKILDETDREVSSIQEELLNYYNRVATEHKKINDCYNLLAKTEIKYRLSLIKQEREYLEKVYDSLLIIKNSSDTKAATEKIQKDLGLSLDSIEAGPSYRYTKRGLNERLIARMKNLPHSINVTTMLGEEELRKLDMSVRLDLNKDGKTLSKQEFVKLAMYNLNGQSQFLNFMWDPTYLSARVMKLSSIGMMYASGVYLGLDESKRVSAKDVMKESFEVTSLIDINAEEKDLLESMGLDTKAKSEEINKLIKTTTDFKGLFDTSFEGLKYFGAVKSPSGILNPLDHALEFYQTYTGVGFFTFKPDDQIFSRLKKSYATSVNNYSAVFGDFLKAVEDCEKTPQTYCPSDLAITYHLSPEHPVYTSQSNFSQARSLLSESNKWYHRSVMKTFNDKTKNCFSNGDTKCEL